MRKIKKGDMRFFFIIFFPVVALGQYFDTIPISNKISFVNYLKSNQQAGDALYMLHYFNSQAKVDSLLLMEAKLLLELRREKEADTLLTKSVNLFPDSSRLKCTYSFLKNHILLLSGKYNEITEPDCSVRPASKEIWRLQLLSAALFQKKTEDFSLVYNSGKCLDPNFSLLEFSMYINNVEISRRKKKSGFVAGLLSTVLPGLGKIYAGKPHESLTAFLPVVFNLAQAAEGYYYKKLDSPHLYIFGSIGTVFYVSNIYGSAKAASRKNQEFNDKIKTNVEFEIAKLIGFY